MPGHNLHSSYVWVPNVGSCTSVYLHDFGYKDELPETTISVGDFGEFRNAQSVVFLRVPNVSEGGLEPPYPCGH